MAQPVDWLGAFIEEELRAVIHWKQRAREIPKVQRDPESRFSDDGSNFRSNASSSNLPAEPKVQLSRVLSTKDPVTVCLTDGFTRVKARLSQTAVSVLEAEIGEKIDLETSKDVVTIKEATVISTPYGPPDEHIQLLVQSIDYLYLLRKFVGPAKPIEERSEALRLLEEITNLRHQQYELSQDAVGSSEPNLRGTQPGASRNEIQVSGRVEHDTPRSQRQIYRSPPTLTQQSPQTQPAIATQVPTRRKANGPSLQKEGFQIQDGANLDRPMQAGLGSSDRRLSLSRDMPTNVGVTGAQLLNLLGKRKADAPPAEQPQHPRPPPLSSNLRPPPQGPEARKVLQQDARPGESVETVPASTGPNASPGAQSMPRSNVSSRPQPRDYSRRKIPKDQQKLLDRASSWLPSLPGHQFSHPNVPIELLKRWNSQMAAKKVNKRQIEPSTIIADNPAEKVKTGSSEIPIEVSESSSSSSSDDDEEIPASQWPPTPSQNRPTLPPDSTIGSEDKQTSLQTRQERPPDSSEEHSLRPSSSHGAQAKVSTHSMNSTPRTPHPLPNRPGWISRENSTHSASPLTTSQRSAQAITHPPGKRLQSSPVQHSTSPEHFNGAQDGRSPSSRMPSQMHRKEFLPVRSNPNTPKSSLATRNLAESPFKTSPTMLVKGTQLEQPEDDEMEMSVPRSLGEDPALMHRRKRSEHFKMAQRREWIRQNYIPDAGGIIRFGSIYSAYRAAQPKDVIKLSDLAEAIRDVYPDLHDSGSSMGLKLRSPKKDQNVESPSREAATVTADLDGAVETPGEIQGESRMSVDHKERKTPVPSTPNGFGDKRQVKPRTSTSLFAQFAAPRASPSSEVNELNKLATPSSDRRLPWAASPTQSRQDSARSRSTQVVIGRRDSFTPTKVPPQAPSHLQKATKQSIRPAETSTRVDEPEEPAGNDLNPPLRMNVQKSLTSKNECQRLRPDNETKPISVFSEFASAWKRLGPGGAFMVEAEPKQHRRQKLNVLNWNL